MRNVKNRVAGLVESLENRSLFAATLGVAVGTGTINGILFNDINSNTTVDAGELPNPGKTVFIDLNNNDALDLGETSTVTDAGGNFTFTGLFPGTHHVRPVLAGGATRTTLPSDITLADGQTISGVLVGVNTPNALGSISGVIFGDANKNGIYDAGDSVGARTVFLDTNGNNALDVGEVSTTSNASTGLYTFSNLSAGTYHVRRTFPSGYSMSTAPIDVALASGQNLTGQNIGSKQGTSSNGTGSIAGILFWDSNRNGTKEASETLQVSKTVFIDANNNGVKDSGEASVLTDSNGAFTFSGLAAGTYRIRRVLPAGYSNTTVTPIVVNLTTGQVVTGLKIGTNTTLV